MDGMNIKFEIQQLKEWVQYYRRLKDYTRADKYQHELKLLTKHKKYGTTKRI